MRRRLDEETHVSSKFKKKKTIHTDQVHPVGGKINDKDLSGG